MNMLPTRNINRKQNRNPVFTFDSDIFDGITFSQPQRYNIKDAGRQCLL